MPKGPSSSRQASHLSSSACRSQLPFTVRGKNSVDLFQEIIMKKVSGIRQFTNERSFAVLLENDNSLVFAMHGARANVIWFKGDDVNEIFRNNFQGDLEIKLYDLDRSIDWSFENFEKNQSMLQSIYFTFGKPVWSYLKAHQFESLGLIESLGLKARWDLLQQTLKILEKPSYHIINKESLVSLSLLPSDNIEKTFNDPIEAVNEFFSSAHLNLLLSKREIRAPVPGKWKAQTGGILS